MITERQFRDLVTCLETGRIRPSIREITVTADTVGQTSAGGYAELYLRRIELRVAPLLQMWMRGELESFSVEVETARGIRHGCVHRCDDGTVQRALCSETVDDVLHCIEALKGRCGR
jgi:hypothetical protein